MKILNPKFEEADKIFSDAITDISAIDRCIKYVNMKRLYIGDYVELWDRVNSIMKVHGLNLTTIPLLATVCSIPSQKLKKEIEKLAENFDLKNKLSEDKELAEELFFALQSNVQNYYFAQKTRLMSKALLKKILKMLVIACDAFGFGLQPHGLVTVIRIFENSGVEGICLESYRADEVYDEEEYGFYGSEDNEIYYDEFWSTINIEDLIKQL